MQILLQPIPISKIENNMLELLHHKNIFQKKKKILKDLIKLNENFKIKHAKNEPYYFQYMHLKFFLFIYF